MKTSISMKIYKFCNWLILTFGVLHMGYPIYEPRPFNAALMWYFSGGLLLLLSFSLNQINLLHQFIIIEKLTSICNLATAVFVLFLSVVIPEIQVFVLVLIFIFISIISVRKLIIGMSK